MIKKKFVLFIGLVIAIIISVRVLAFNFDIFDTKWNFAYAEIAMPSGEVIKGHVDSWRDYEDSDVVQVNISGITYLTHYSNVVLSDKEK